MAFDLSTAKPAAFDLASAAPVQPEVPVETAEEAGARYRQVFQPSEGQQMFRSGLQQAEAIGEGANFVPLLATQGAYKLFNLARERMGMEPVATPFDAIAAHKQRLGLEPQNAMERYMVAAAQGAGGAGGLTNIARSVASTARSPVASRVAATMAERPVLQSVSGATAGLSSQGAADAGLGVAGQFVAGLVGGLAPGAASAGFGRLTASATGSKAGDLVTKRLAASDLTPEQAANSLLPGQTIAELNKPLGDLAGAVVRRSPSAAAKADNLIESRGAARTTELVSRLDSDVAKTPMTAMQADDFLVSMEAEASPLYQRAFETAPKIVIPKELLRRDSVVDAYRKAQALARENGFSLPDINPAAVQPIPPLSLRQADFLKRAMDDVLFVSRAPETGVGKQMSGSMKATRTLLVKAIDNQAGPEYAAARAKFAGPAEARDALELGMKADKMTAEQINRYLTDPKVSEFEKQAFRIGQANKAKQKIASASDSRESAGLFASPNAQQSLEQASMQDGPSFIPELLSRHRKQAAFEQRLTGGSQTQPRRAADADLEQQVPEVPEFSAWNVLNAALRYGRDRAMTGGQKTVDDLERMLFSTDQRENTNALRRLQMMKTLQEQQPGYLEPSAYGSLGALQQMGDPAGGGRYMPLLGSK